MESVSSISLFGIYPMILIIFNGLFKLLAIYSLYLFIKLAIRGIQALDIYLEEKRGRRL